MKIEIIYHSACAFCILIAYLFINIAAIKAIYGGLWAGDWYEHYDRSLFFLENWPLESRFLDVYSLPARPPLVNVVSAQLLSLGEASFALYQLSILSYGSFVFFPLVALIEYFSSKELRVNKLYVLVLGLGATPFFLQNISFTWTRMLCNFFILQGLICQLNAHRFNEGKHRLWAYGFMGFAFIAHYSAGPYIVAMVLAEFLKDLFDKAFLKNFKYWFWGGLSGFLAVSIWWSWSIFNYGIEGTFLSNSSVTMVSEKNFLHWSSKVIYNIYTSLVPIHIRGNPPPIHSAMASEGLLGFREKIFYLYQVSWFWFVGPAVFVAWLGISIHSKIPKQTIVYWIVYGFISFILGIASHGPIDHYGLSHVCLQALALTIIVFVVSKFDLLSRPAKFLIWIFWFLSWLTGVLLNIIVQSFIQLRDEDSMINILSGDPPTSLWLSLVGKFEKGYLFLGDLVYLPFLSFLILNILLVLLLVINSKSSRETLPVES